MNSNNRIPLVSSNSLLRSPLIVLLNILNKIKQTPKSYYKVRIYREIRVEINRFCVIMPPPRGLFHAPLRHDLTSSLYSVTSSGVERSQEISPLASLGRDDKINLLLLFPNP